MHPIKGRAGGQVSLYAVNDPQGQTSWSELFANAPSFGGGKDGLPSIVGENKDVGVVGKVCLTWGVVWLELGGVSPGVYLDDVGSGVSLFCG